MHNAMKFTSRTNHRNRCREPKPKKGQKLHAFIAMALLAQCQQRKSHKKDPVDEFVRCVLLQTAACSQSICLKAGNVPLGSSELIFVIVAFLQFG